VPVVEELAALVREPVQVAVRDQVQGEQALAAQVAVLERVRVAVSQIRLL
jgi:hypothetical protein